MRIICDCCVGCSNSYGSDDPGGPWWSGTIPRWRPDKMPTNRPACTWQTSAFTAERIVPLNPPAITSLGRLVSVTAGPGQAAAQGR